MRTIREMFRLCLGKGWSQRQSARRCGIGHPTVGEYLRRLEAAGLDWAQASAMDEAALEAKLFAPPPPPSAARRAEPDWAEVHRELRRKGVTLMLLWQEYKAAHPDGFQYTWFCDHYRAWVGKLDVVMRQHHRAGEKLFIDYSGQTMPVIDRHTGEIRQAEIFIAGPCGTGQSQLAQPLGHFAARRGYDVPFTTQSQLLGNLHAAKATGSYERRFQSIARVDLLIIDDFGLAALSAPQRRDLLELLDDRHGHHPTLVCAQMPVDHWHELIGDPTIADAILDRLVHSAYRITLKGESMRKRRSPRLTTAARSE